MEDEENILIEILHYDNQKKKNLEIILFYNELNYPGWKIPVALSTPSKCQGVWDSPQVLCHVPCRYDGLI